MTTIGHDRIQFGGRWVYFPPKDSQLFLAIVEARAVQLQKVGLAAAAFQADVRGIAGGVAPPF